MAILHKSLRMLLLRNAIFVILLALAVAATPPVYYYYKGTLSASPLPPTAKADAVIVFTGSPDRLIEGTEMYLEGKAKRMMITGTDYPNDIKGPGVRKLLKKIRKDKIYVDLKAKNTIENAKNGAEWAIKNNVKSILLITNEAHMPRAYFELRHLLPKQVKIYTNATPGGNKKYSALDSEKGRLLCRMYETATDTSFCYKARSITQNLGL